MLKKIFIALGVIAGLFVVAALLLPVFVDANKYRPQIEKLVEENINADLDLGKLTFSLWGGLHIEVEKLILSEKGSRGARPIVSLRDAKLEIPIASVFTGAPEITLAVNRPELRVVSGLDGKLNLSKLSPSAAPASAGQPQQPGASTATTAQNAAPSGANKKAGLAALPFKLGFHIVDGNVVYVDQRKNTKTEIGGINFDLQNFGLNRRFTFDFDSNLRVGEMKDLVLEGPAKIDGKAGIYVGLNGFERADLETKIDLSGLAVKYGTLFNKLAEAPLKAAVKLAATGNSLKIETGHFEVEDAAVDATGTIDNFDAPVVNLNVLSTKFIFDHWQKVLEPLRRFDMKGAADFNVKVTGPVSNIGFDGAANVQNVSLKAPGIVPRITELNSKLNFATDTATLSATSMRIGDSDLELAGTVKSFKAPVIVFNVKSQFLDLDAMLPQTAQPQKSAALMNILMPEAVAAEETGPIAALKQNPIARALNFTGHAVIGKIRIHHADLEGLNADLTFKDLVMKLAKATAKVFGGGVSVDSTVDFRGAEPAYSVAGNAKGVDVNQAITSQMPSMKNTIFGKIVSDFSISGSGITKARAMQTLKGKGKFVINNGSWSSLTAMKQIGQKLKSLPGNLGAQLGNVNLTDRFRDLKADFTIGGGRVNITNMVADLENANVALTGAGYVDFDENENIEGRLMAGYSPMKDIPQKLRSPDGRRVSLPYKLGCKVTAPCPSTDIGYIASAVAQHELKGQAGRELKKAIGDKIKNPQVQDLLNKLNF